MECDFRRPRPDFCIHSPEPFLVEAAVALHAQGTPAVTETNPLDVPPNFKELNTQAIIRLSNTCIPNTRSIWNRTRNCRTWLENRSCWLSPLSDRPFFQFQAERAIEASFIAITSMTILTSEKTRIESHRFWQKICLLFIRTQTGCFRPFCRRVAVRNQRDNSQYGRNLVEGSGIRWRS